MNSPGRARLLPVLAILLAPLAGCDTEGVDPVPFDPSTVDYDQVQGTDFGDYVQPLLAARNVFAPTAGTTAGDLSDYTWAAIFGGAATVPEAARPFIVTGVIAFSLFMLSQFLANQFGYDRDGFRTFVLSPVDRRWILLGKNLATAVVGGGFGLVLLLAVVYWLRLPLADAAAALVQLGIVLALGSLAGNLLSILMPFRIEPGSILRPGSAPAR